MNLVYKKLQLIIKLSKYTNTRYAELQKLHTALINNELLPLRDIISGVKFFTLD